MAAERGSSPLVRALVELARGLEGGEPGDEPATVFRPLDPAAPGEAPEAGDADAGD